MTLKKEKKVIGYTRVSSESQIENTSIVEQKKKIRSFSEAQDWTVERIFIDEGYSGVDIKRPAYQEMMRYLEKNASEIGAVVVVKMDRAHRNQLNLLRFIKEELAVWEVDFVSVTEAFDTSTAIGRMMLSILSTFGEFERETINERTKSGRLATAKNNKYAGGQVPYGYTVLNGEIKTVKEQAVIVKRIFNDYIEGYSYYKIAKLLNKEGHYTKTGKKWYPQTIKNIILTETYTGFNRYHGEKEKNEIRQRGIFPKIISRQVWNKVQKGLQ
ncbi:recombinase family protein [Priestia aryabhattai]|uniref:recombinase family protein n=1 Tax=Priestia aryabhattai TaxID=412384 RepID=UPI003D2BF17E